MRPPATQVKAYVNDKRLLHGNVRARTGNEILKGFRALKAKAPAFSLPIYVSACAYVCVWQAGL